MKIGTDAVLLGSWVPCRNESRILDIGTGSGILALMMAQRNAHTPVDAVEINQEAAILAQHNADLSPWADQIHILHSSLQDFIHCNTIKYSLIVCNPPFFANSLKTPDSARNLARHNDTLPIDILLEATVGLLEEQGRAAFIFPFNDFGKWLTEAGKYSLYLAKYTRVRSLANHEPHRVMALFSTEKQTQVTEDELCIYSSKNLYSDEYRLLTKDFYLKF